MKQVIKATEQNLVAVFGDDYLFEIPLYQRPYAWTPEQVDELLDDLLSAQRRDADSPYFLGSIVLIKGEGRPDSAVVDGQQRLTTLAMIFCVLRDLVSEDSKLAADIDALIRQEGNDIKGTEAQFRLGLRERDREFFDNHVQAKGGIPRLLSMDAGSFTESQQRIITNVKRIHQELERLTSADRRSLATFIAQQCYLVVVTATDQESAYRIFSVMNDRGIDLSPTDILKAETIGGLQEVDQVEYGAKWESIEERLGRDSFRDLFAHIRMIIVRAKLRQTLQADFQASVLSQTSGAKFIDHILEPYADIYETVRDASYESAQDAEPVNRYLSYLGRLDNFDWIPAAMAFFHQHANDRDQLLRFTKDLERLAYGLFVLRANVTERINRYAEVLREIEQGHDLSNPDSRLQLTAGEEESIRLRLNGGVYLWAAIARRVLLQRLDSLVAERGATYDHKMTTVEHVLPQNPKDNSEWVRWFPKEEVRQTWTHRLANLVLLSRRKNSQASNWDFERKKKEYFQRKGVVSFALTTQVVSEPEWTPRVLERRQRQLIDALSAEWRLG